MKAKLIIDGKEIEVEITQEQLEKLCPSKKKTGYERVEKNKDYWYVGSNINVYRGLEEFLKPETDLYDGANYYTDKTVAENNARADKLMRQLRRFAVEHREKELDWNNFDINKYRIVFDWKAKTLIVEHNVFCEVYGAIYFDSTKTTELAIDTFKDELLWYFTEYKDSL